jgi:phosphatidate cytidylyltransferase
VVYQRKTDFHIEEHRNRGMIVLAAVTGILNLSLFWVSLVFIRDIPFFGVPLLIFALLLIFVTDTAAYFIGRACGKNKLALKISPGKTWEGYFGGLCGAALIGCLGAWYFWPTLKTRLFFILICLVIGAMSVVGDLLESFFKRYSDLKESGKLLPGHGGLLDRLDSLSVSLPLFALGLMFMQWL